MPTATRISDEAVLKATGKTVKDWIKILDKAGAKDLPHKDIARILWDKKLIKKGWWCQMVTVEYERARGKRILGQTADAGFEIGVQKTLPLSAKEAWKLLLSSAGLKIWLGTLSTLTLKKGAEYTTKEGTTGEVRSVYPEEKLRLTWKPKNKKAPSTIQLYLNPVGKKVSVLFHHEKLTSSKERAEMQKHWKKALEKLVDVA